MQSSADSLRSVSLNTNPVSNETQRLTGDDEEIIIKKICVGAILLIIVSGIIVSLFVIKS
jgi:hypothetical protein